MTAADREARLVRTFATLADTLVDAYDVVELLQTLVDTCVDVLDISAAGLMLADTDGALDVIASTSEASRLIEVLQLDAEAGPCLACFTTGEPVSCADIADVPAAWAAFRTGAVAHGFRSVHAVPLRLRATVIGTLNLFGAEPGELSAANLTVARALADVATIGILHERNVTDPDTVTTQLRATIDSRAVIEQAKGVVSFTRRIGIDEAFGIIRHHAAATGAHLSDVARAIVERRLRL